MSKCRARGCAAMDALTYNARFMNAQAHDTASPPPSLSVPEGSIRETLESIVIAFVLAFVFRAFVVEAFVIPTGSMAPTLLGAHVTVTCPQCGYHFMVGPRDHGTDGLARSVQGGGRYGALEMPCPMCQFPIRHESMNTNAGDRILVLKYVYAFSEPRRWDVVVFKNPEQPEINYIKRLIGLPKEQLWIVDGNIYTRPLTQSGTVPPQSTPWQIQRKPEKVQRAVWQPIYHSDYLPLDAGEVNSTVGGRLHEWKMPWRAFGPTAGDWHFDTHGPVWVYDNAQAQPGALGFEFNALTAVNYYSYNTLTRDGPQGSNLVEDLRLAATVTPDAAGLRVVMHLAVAESEFRALVEPDGQVLLQVRPRKANAPIDNESDWSTQARAQATALAAGRPVRVELWHVDQELSFWLDGRHVAAWEYDRDVAELARRGRPSMAPQVALAVQGARATLRSIDLDRDLYYTQQGRGALATHDRPATIHADRFFCLGDNSPQSKDSRLWDGVDDWVRYNVATDQEKQYPRDLVGYVPRDLMIGRAFFVYFPAPHRLSPDSMGFIPNFGRMRFIH